ncbi:MAG: hypothetical protein M3R50_00670 [Bacteroidota bacterium]|nr:hypothetical protein [Bacteroidota bacterium]
MEAIESQETKLSKLQFYRTEIQHEYSLLYSRTGTYVTSQSFLTIAFASAMVNRNAASNDIFSLWFPIILSLIGIVTSITVRGGVDGAVGTIALWHVKQNKLFESDPAMNDYHVEWKHSHSGNPVDAKHRRILEFAQVMPYVFLTAWILFAFIAIYLHVK